MAKLNDPKYTNELQIARGEDMGKIFTKLYLGEIIDSLNKDLFKFNIQIRLIFNQEDTGEINRRNNYDQSCQLESLAQNRLTTMASVLEDLNQNFVGLHFYIFACIHQNDSFDLTYVLKHGTCGRDGGIMYKNRIINKICNNRINNRRTRCICPWKTYNPRYSSIMFIFTTMCKYNSD